tara:strand:- start:256 stop:555 length:300 start_codon:yes stop_codon:yes gene_type:complete
MSRYATSRIIKDENGKRRANTTIIPAPELSSQDIYIQITSPERLDLLADQFYGDATLWWIIATTNGLGKGTLFTPEGITIRIPPAQDIQSIIELQNKER